MPENKKILLLGAGGHCRSVLDSLNDLGSYDVIALIEKKITEEDSSMFDSKDILSSVPIIGEDRDLERLHSEGYTDAFITIGSIGDVTIRRNLYTQLKNIGFHIPNIIDRSSIVSSHAILGEGIFIGKKVVVNANARIGNCAIINTASVIEHDCSVGDFVHVATGSILCGNVIVESRTHIGSGSVIRQGIHIGEDTMIGMGSVVINDIADNTVAYGNPCRERTNIEKHLIINSD